MHAYPSSTTSSTCVVECSPGTWQGLQLDTLDSDEGLRLLEETFRRTLRGRRLFGQSRAEPSRWQRFQHLSNRTWCHRNVVLMGDVAHAAHFTLAVGTRQALKDAVALADSLRAEPELSGALHRYHEQRREDSNHAVATGRRRSEKWEHLDGLLDRDVLDFIHAKSGMSDAELRRRRPRHRAEQLDAVRMVRRQVGAVRRWRHARQYWAGVDPRTAAPAPSEGRSTSAGV